MMLPATEAPCDPPEPAPELTHKDRLIADYVHSMRQLKAQAAAASNAINGAQFDEYVLKRFFPVQYERDRRTASTTSSSPQSSSASAAHQSRPFRRPNLPKLRYALVGTVVAVCVLVALLTAVGPLLNVAAGRQHLAGLFMLYVQPLIHPGMSLWRSLTLPLLGLWPSLTALYDESCLLANPFFHIAGMDCRPCAEVHSVLDFSGRPIAVDESRPHVYHFNEDGDDDESAISVERFYALFRNQSQVFRSDAYDVRSTLAGVQNLDELFAAFGFAADLGGNRSDGELEFVS